MIEKNIDFFINLINKEIKIKDIWYFEKGLNSLNYNTIGFIQNINILIKKNNFEVFYNVRKNDNTNYWFNSNDIEILE